MDSHLFHFHEDAAIVIAPNSDVVFQLKSYYCFRRAPFEDVTRLCCEERLWTKVVKEEDTEEKLRILLWCHSDFEHVIKIR